MAPEPETADRFEHSSVLLVEVMQYLEPRPGGVYVDATLGGGGHAEAVLEASSPDGLLIGIDRDPSALEAAGVRLRRFGTRALLRHGRFSEIATLVSDLKVGLVDGVMADLGVSSPQLDRADRGFSFTREGPLDMRMDPGATLTAGTLVNEAPVDDLIRIFRDFGEERHAARIARAIGHDRRRQPFASTRQLASMIERVVGRSPRDRIHPATRVFQALRIAVNDELGELEAGLAGAFSILKPGGRMAIISFHSLEDRITKDFFRDRAASCICPPELPVCRCEKVSELKILTRKPVEAGSEEVASNARARSARLRAAERLAPVSKAIQGPAR